MGRRKSQKPALRTNFVSTYGLANAEKMAQPNATQAQAVLPPSQAAMRRAIEAGMCPWCGRGSYLSLASHTVRVHGVSARELRELAGLLYSDTICAPEMSAQRAAAARTNDGLKRAAASEAVRHGPRRPRQLSEAAKALSRARLEKARSPEQIAKALAASQAPEVRARAAATLRAHVQDKWGPLEHGTVRMYRNKCRCESCRAANNAAQRAYQRSRRENRHT